MITQDLKNPKSQGLGGLLIVLGILLAIFLAVILSALARPLVGALASTLFVWLVGGCVALYITRRFVLKFRYSMDARRLRIERVYGERARFMLEFPLDSLLKVGTPEEIQAAYPSAHRSNAALKDVPMETVALAYKQEGKVRLLLMQPNEEIRARLLNALRKG